MLSCISTLEKLFCEASMLLAQSRQLTHKGVPNRIHCSGLDEASFLFGFGQFLFLSSGKELWVSKPEFPLLTPTTQLKENEDEYRLLIIACALYCL